MSGGSYTVSPFFTYTPSLPATLVAGTTYVFNANGIDNPHYFRAGTARDVTPAWITGDTAGLYGSYGTITVAVPADYTGDVVLYCNPHTQMTFTIGVSASGPSTGPQPSSPPSPPTTSDYAHPHTFGDTVWWMPNDFPGAQHGGDCPTHATLLPASTVDPSAPQLPPPSRGRSLPTAAAAETTSQRPTSTPRCGGGLQC